MTDNAEIRFFYIHKMENSVVGCRKSFDSESSAQKPPLCIPSLIPETDEIFGHGETCTRMYTFKLGIS